MIEKRRITFVIQNLAGLRGGAERVLVTIARGLSERGHDVNILTYDGHAGAPVFDPGKVPVKSVFPGASARPARAVGYGRNRWLRDFVKRLPNGPLLARAKWAATHGLFSRRLATALNLDHPDVVVAFLPPAIAAVAAALEHLPPGPRPRFIASTHGEPSADFDDGSLRWDRNPIYRRKARKALSAADAVTLLQPEFGSWYPADLAGRLIVIPNPVSRVSPHPFPLPDREDVILAVGRLAKEKRHDLLIAAFSRIAADLPGWSVVICGEGPERAALQARIAALGLAERVRLPGITANVGAWYDRASILCHPSEHEGFGLAVAESMAHGLPVVAFSDCSGVNRLIRNDEDGILVPPADDRAAALAAVLKELASDRDRRVKLGSAALGLADRFGSQEILDRWEELVAARPSGGHGSS